MSELQAAVDNLILPGDHPDPSIVRVGMLASVKFTYQDQSYEPTS